MLTLIEKSYVRDLLTVPMSGVPTGGHTSGYRYLGRVGQLEFYMNNLGIEEESIITGRPIGLIVATGDPSLGQVLTVNVNGSPASYVTQVSDLSAYDPRGTVLAQLVTAINAMGNGYVSGRVNFQPSQAGQPFTTSPTIGQLMVTGKNTCSLSVMTSPGGVNLAVAMDGNSYPEPSLDIRDRNTGTTSAIHGYIPVCLQLRKDIISARVNLSLLSAGAKGDQGGATFRPSEIADRVELFRYFTGMLGNALYAGPDPTGRGGTGGRVRV